MPRAGRDLGELRRELAVVVDKRRHLLAAGFAAAAAAAAVTAVSPAPPRLTEVLAAARDLPGGSPVSAHDLMTVALPPDAVPPAALRPGVDLTGRVLAAPMRRGEPLTDVRLLGPSLLAALGRPGLVAVPVRVAESGTVGFVRAGDTVDVLAAADALAAGGTGGVVASGLTVLTAVRDGATDPAARVAADGALVVLAATREQAAALARVAAARLTLAVRGGP